MTNADSPKDATFGGAKHLGLTKREYFAGLAMQGITANENSLPTKQVHFTNVAKDSVRMSDELLRALEE